MEVENAILFKITHTRLPLIQCYVTFVFVLWCVLCNGGTENKIKTTGRRPNHCMKLEV